MAIGSPNRHAGETIADAAAAFAGDKAQLGRHQGESDRAHRVLPTRLPASTSSPSINPACQLKEARTLLEELPE
jgi:hypothetical protein